MDSVVASLLPVAFFSPPRLRRGAGAAGGVVCHRVEPPRRSAPPAPASRVASRLAFAGGKCAQAHLPNSLLTLIRGGKEAFVRGGEEAFVLCFPSFPRRGAG